MCTFRRYFKNRTASEYNIQFTRHSHDLIFDYQMALELLKFKFYLNFQKIFKISNRHFDNRLIKSQQLENFYLGILQNKSIFICSNIYKI